MKIEEIIERFIKDVLIDFANWSNEDLNSNDVENYLLSDSYKLLTNKQ